MRLKAKFPANCKKFPADSRISGNLDAETGSIATASTTISRPEKSANPAHCDNCGGASSCLTKPRTVPRCLPDLGTAWAKRSRKVLDGPLNAKRPASAEAKCGAHERSKSKSRDTNGKRRNPTRASRNHVPT